jgi:hypothetical protein
VRAHIALLLARESISAEGGEELEDVLRRFEDCAGTFRAGVAEADDIAVAAQMSLDRLRSCAIEAEIESEQGPIAAWTAQQWVTGRWSQALGDELSSTW